MSKRLVFSVRLRILLGCEAGEGELVLLTSESYLLADEALEESDEISVSIKKSTGQPKRQEDFEEAPNLASVTQPLVQVLRMVRPIEGN